MVMDLKRRSNSITPTSLAYHTAGAITRRVDGRPGAHFRTPKCIVKESSDNSNVLVCNQTICEEMQKFPNSLMLMYDNRSQQKIGGSGPLRSSNIFHHVCSIKLGCFEEINIDYLSTQIAKLFF